MAYLQPTDYPKFGLPAGTSADWITAATALINSYCRRPDLNVMQYAERVRLTSGAQTARLSYLPLTPIGNATTPIVKIEGRYARPRRGEIVIAPLCDAACAFNLPGQWVEINPNELDLDPNTGDLTLPGSILGLSFNEINVTYTAGLAVIGNDIKAACAQIVRNAQATPALNVCRMRIDTMQMEYFSSSLLDEIVQTWLRPYVAAKLG
jgi:hypothetical protein